jgi:hypothetical protein
VKLGRVLADLSGKLERADLEAAIKVLSARMSNAKPTETELLVGFGEGFAGLRDKLNSAELKAVAQTILAAITGPYLPGYESRRQEDFEKLAVPLELLAEKLEAKDAKPLEVKLLSLINETDLAVPSLINVWSVLESVAYADQDPKNRIEVYVNILKLPFAADAQKKLLSGLETLTKKRFGDSVWNFVTWATQSETTINYHIDLDDRSTRNSNKTRFPVPSDGNKVLLQYLLYTT